MNFFETFGEKIKLIAEEFIAKQYSLGGFEFFTNIIFNLRTANVFKADSMFKVMTYSN